MYRLFTLVSAPPGWLALLLGTRQHRHCQRITLVSPKRIQLVYAETIGSMSGAACTSSSWVISIISCLRCKHLVHVSCLTQPPIHEICTNLPHFFCLKFPCSCVLHCLRCLRHCYFHAVQCCIRLFDVRCHHKSNRRLQHVQARRSHQPNHLLC